MRKRPKYTPDMALDEVLFEARKLVLTLQYASDGFCPDCDGHGKHHERCHIRDVIWNLENHWRAIND